MPREKQLRQENIAYDGTLTDKDLSRLNNITIKDSLYPYSPEKRIIFQNSKSPNLRSHSEKNRFGEKCSTSTGFCTRIDIGTGFNMRIKSTGTDSLNQFTTIKSETPRLETSRMADASFNLAQRTKLSIPSLANGSPQKVIKSQRCATPQSPKTPQLSHGTHGWARLPHGRVNLITWSNESPRKVNEENVNKKMTGTPIRRLRSIRTYTESPPPVTISKDRRPHGTFSPRSVYKRQLLSQRDLFGDGNKSAGPGQWIDEYGLYSNENSVKRSDHTLSWDTSAVFETDPTYSSSESTPAEELNWSGLFSPDTPVDPLQRQDQPLGRFVSQPRRTMRYFQPSNGFIPGTF